MMVLESLLGKFSRFSYNDAQSLSLSLTFFWWMSHPYGWILESSARVNFINLTFLRWH